MAIDNLLNMQQILGNIQQQYPIKPPTFVPPPPPPPTVNPRNSKRQNWADALYLLGGALKGNDMSQDMAMLQQSQQLRTARDNAAKLNAAIDGSNLNAAQKELAKANPELFAKYQFESQFGSGGVSTLIENAQYLSKLREDLRKETDKNKKDIIQRKIDDVVALGSVGKYDPELRANVTSAIESAKTGTETVLTPGQKTEDSAFATRYVKWEGGERQQAEQNLKNLNDKLDILASGDKNVSGPFLGQIPEGIRAFTNPDSLAFIGDIRDVVFQSLRATLGAQFTEKEGERLVAAAFDARLSEEENYKRLKRLVEKIQDTKNSMEAMSAHWKKNGTLQGYESKQIVFQDVFDSFAEEDFIGKSDEELRILYDEGDITLQNSIINFLEKREK